MRSESIKWRAERIFHRCNPANESDITDDHPVFGWDDYDVNRCDAAQCIEVDVTIRDCSATKFCAGWMQSDGIYGAEEFNSPRAFAEKNLPEICPGGISESLWDIFCEFCNDLVKAAFDTRPEID